MASCTAYEDAVRAVECMVAAGLPTDAVAIDGLRLRPLDDVARERAPGREALAGTLGGTLAGVAVSFLGSALSWVDSLGRSLELAFYGLLLGALVGAAAGLLTSFAPPSVAASVAQLRADVYAVAVQPEFASRTPACWRGARSADHRDQHPLNLS